MWKIPKDPEAGGLLNLSVIMNLLADLTFCFCLSTWQKKLNNLNLSLPVDILLSTLHNRGAFCFLSCVWFKLTLFVISEAGACQMTHHDFKGACLSHRDLLNFKVTDVSGVSQCRQNKPDFSCWRFYHKQNNLLNLTLASPFFFFFLNQTDVYLWRLNVSTCSNKLKHKNSIH